MKSKILSFESLHGTSTERFSCVGFSSVQSLSRVRLCDPMNRSTPVVRLVSSKNWQNISVFHCLEFWGDYNVFMVIVLFYILSISRYCFCHGLWNQLCVIL